MKCKIRSPQGDEDQNQVDQKQVLHTLAVQDGNKQLFLALHTLHYNQTDMKKDEAK